MIWDTSKCACMFSEMHRYYVQVDIFSLIDLLPKFHFYYNVEQKRRMIDKLWWKIRMWLNICTCSDITRLSRVMSSLDADSRWRWQSWNFNCCVAAVSLRVVKVTPCNSEQCCKHLPMLSAKMSEKLATSMFICRICIINEYWIICVLSRTANITLLHPTPKKYICTW